jgi:hypothetical protein
MPTKYDYLQGKVAWFKHHRLNDWNKWTHVMYLNPASLEKFRAWQESDTEFQGIKNTLKKDEDGYFVTLSRPCAIKRRGREEALAAPQIFESDGKTPWQEGLVGNGSDVTTKLEVYDYPIPGNKLRGRAIRWLSSKVDHLVPYEGTRDNTPSEVKASRGLDKQPPMF